MSQELEPHFLRWGEAGLLWPHLHVMTLMHLPGLHVPTVYLLHLAHDGTML